MQQPQIKHWLMLASLSIFWGFAFYLIAVGLESFLPLTLFNIRLAVGGLALYSLMRCAPRRISGVLLGFAGVLNLIGGDVLVSLGGGQLMAQLAVLAATFAYASNAVYTRRIPRIDTLVVATGHLDHRDCRHVAFLALCGAALAIVA